MSKRRLIPREVLYGTPEHLSPRVSPDGTRLAWLAPAEGVLTLWESDVARSDARPLLRSARSITRFWWAADSSCLLFPQDTAGDELYRLHRVDLVDGSTTDLTPYDNVHAKVIAVSTDVPGSVLVALNKDDPGRHDAYILNVETGALERAAMGGDVLDPVADRWLRVRAGLRYRDDAGVEVVARDDDGSWRLLASWSPEEVGEPFGPVAVSPDSTGLYVRTAAGARTSRLVELSLADGSVLRVVAEDPDFDLGEVHLHPTTHEVQWVEVERDVPGTVVVDPSVVEVFASLREELGGEPLVVSRDTADRWWVLRVLRPDGPEEFHLHDRRTGASSFLFHDRPALAAHRLGVREPFTFATRDGRRMHGLVTAPVDTPRDRLPVALWVHGGPWERSHYGFHPLAHLYADRGYLAVEVDYRGSAGYGVEHLEAGNREWGRAMSTDLIDAVDDLARRGWAEPKRVAITGGSYGGYATLAGLAFFPDQYTCGVDLVGPANLQTLLRSFPPYWGPYLVNWYRRVGHPELDADVLWERSPVSRADQITAPLLVVQTDNDPRVPKAESDQMVRALEAAGTPCRYEVFEGEGHGFTDHANWVRCMALIEHFLAEHLGGRAEP